MGNHTPVGVIYGLHNGDGEIRYVGKTTMTARRRFSAHLTAARSDKATPVAHWLRKYADTAQIVILETLTDGLPAHLDPLERRLISEHRARPGSRMLNLTDGGEGQPGHSPSADTRKRLSQAGMGRIYTAEQRRRISGSLKGRKLSPRHVERIRASKFGDNNHFFGVPKSAKFKESMSAFQKQRWSDPAVLAKMAASIRESPNLGLGQHRRWHEARGVSNPECKFCIQKPI